jgi:hypothetical protein
MMIDGRGSEARPETRDATTAVEARDSTNFGLLQAGDDIANLVRADAHIAVAEDLDFVP